MLKPIFSRNEDHRRIAFLNWRFQDNDEILNLFNMGEGYLDASIVLARECLRNNQHKQADIIVFPMVTSANHGIELYLKGYLWTLNFLLNRERKIEGRHDIKQILQTVKTRIRDYKGAAYLKYFKKQVVELDNYISELYKKINSTPQNDKLDFSRYPFDKKYENHFCVETLGNVEIDLENFIDRFSIIKQKLGSFSETLYYDDLQPRLNNN
jgi:hypothetical protein